VSGLFFSPRRLRFGVGQVESPLRVVARWLVSTLLQTVLLVALVVIAFGLHEFVCRLLGAS
jgi:hypothetical protein